MELINTLSIILLLYSSTVKTKNVIYHVSPYFQLRIFFNVFPVSLFNYAHFVCSQTCRSNLRSQASICTMASFGGRVNIRVAVTLYEITLNSA